MIIFSPLPGIISDIQKENQQWKISIESKVLFSLDVKSPCEGVVQSIIDDGGKIMMELALRPNKLISLVGNKDDLKDHYLMPGDKLTQGALLFKLKQSTQFILLMDCNSIVKVDNGSHVIASTILAEIPDKDG